MRQGSCSGKDAPRQTCCSTSCKPRHSSCKPSKQPGHGYRCGDSSSDDDTCSNRGPRGHQGEQGCRGMQGPQGMQGMQGMPGPRGPPGPPGQLDIRTLTHKRSNGSSLPFPRRPVGCVEVQLPIELLNQPFTLEDNGHRMLNTSRVQRASFSFEITHKEVQFRVGDISYSVTVEVNMLLAKTKSNISVITIYDQYGLSVTYEFLKHLHQVKGKHQFWNPAWLSAYLDASLLALNPELKVDLATISCLDDIAVKSSYLLNELAHLDSLQLKMTEELQQADCNMPAEILALITNNPTLSKSIYDSVQQERKK